MLKEILKSVLPVRSVAAITADRWWGHVIKSQSAKKNFYTRLIAQHGITVKFGPFKGMIIPEQMLLEVGGSERLLGTYELEIHPWLEHLFGKQYELVVDIGCAEGYYAVGMAMRLGVPVDAYDPAPFARKLCNRLAEANHVAHRVRVLPWCDAKALHQLDGRRCLVLSDCEGFENALFTNEIVQVLRNSDVLIELHDHGVPTGTTRDRMLSRFAGHDCEVVGRNARNSTDFLHLANLDPDMTREAISEDARGGEQEWLLCKAQIQGSE